jgi:hypothetical protein
MASRDECASCGAELPAPAVNDPTGERTPCPNCGSTARRFVRSVSDAAGASDSIGSTRHLFISNAATTSDPVRAGTAVGTRVAEYHLTVLADRSELGGLVVRLVDERDPGDIAAVHVGDKDDVIVELAIDVSRIIGGSA